jgi:hypothetical protein
MKLCLNKRKSIALLAANSLADREKRELKNHLDSCERCRAYFEEITSVTRKLQLTQSPTCEQPSEMFHRNLMGALVGAKRESAWADLWANIEAALNGRLVLPAAVAVALTMTVWFAVAPRRSAPIPAPVAFRNIAAPRPKPDLQPTFANYEMALHQSVDKLDELLTEQGNRTAPPSPTYTAALLPQRSLTD